MRNYLVLLVADGVSIAENSLVNKVNNKCVLVLTSLMIFGFRYFLTIKYFITERHTFSVSKTTVNVHNYSNAYGFKVSKVNH